MPPRAPRLCSHTGCVALVYGSNSRCAEHQPRRGSNRPFGAKTGVTNRTATTLHKARRLRIIKRDPICRLAFEGCETTSTILDHRIPLAAAVIVGMTEAMLDVDANCQGCCRHCHGIKTSREGNYLRGANVPCPWDNAALQTVRQAAAQAAMPAIPRTIFTRY